MLYTASEVEMITKQAALRGFREGAAMSRNCKTAQDVRDYSIGAMCGRVLDEMAKDGLIAREEVASNG
jgi:hypothetical protein